MNTYGPWFLTNNGRDPAFIADEHGNTVTLPQMCARYNAIASRAAMSSQLAEQVLLTLRHARLFITSREKMHPDGVELYDRLIARLERLERGGTLLREPFRGSPDVPRDADGRPVPYRPNKPAGQA